MQTTGWPARSSPPKILVVVLPVGIIMELLLFQIRNHSIMITTSHE